MVYKSCPGGWACKDFTCSAGDPGFPGGTSGKEPTCQCRLDIRDGCDPWDGKVPLEQGMATHASILAWRIPWIEEPDKLQSMRLQRAGHDWVTNTFTFFTFRGSTQIQSSLKWDRILGLHHNSANLWLGTMSASLSFYLSHIFSFYSQCWILFVYLLLVVLGLCCCTGFL